VKASEAGLLRLLQGTKQFVIPIYQRTYSWTRAQCRQLWDDIAHAATNDTVGGHFIGSVVYIQEGVHHQTSVPELRVIDGQQRLTTISLLLAALARVIENGADGGEMTPRKIRNYYLFNADEDGDLRYKLVLTQGDRETLIRIVDGTPLPEIGSQRLLQNYRYFEEWLREPDVAPAVLYQGLAKLLIVDVALEQGRDNPQLIFESLNSTGLALSQADLIRNYVLMGLERAEQTALYEDYWHPMERLFGQTEYSERFDRFMRDYLTIKMGAIPKLEAVYTAFKAYVQGRGGLAAARETVAEIYQLARLWTRIAGIREEPDPEVRRVLADIHALHVEVAYPFLLELYANNERGYLSHGDFVELLRLVESYVFRRAICAIPTNTLNKTFAGLSRELDKSAYLLSFKLALWRKDSYRRFPRDEEFKRALVSRDIYNLRTRNYLLRKLENHGRKEPVPVEEYTIEHVLPQNTDLSAEWRAELGADWQRVHERLLHTLGNLTLTGYNPELSDRSFSTKRDMAGGFRDSPLRLNRTLAQCERWDAAAIEQRANALADVAAEVWPQPSVPAELQAQVRRARRAGVYTLADHEALRGEVLDLFEHLRRRVLNLDVAVTEEIHKPFITYKATTQFLDVVPEAGGLTLFQNLPVDETLDPKGLCREVAGVGHWGSGYAMVSLQRTTELDDVLDLVAQAFERHVEEDTFDLDDAPTGAGAGSDGVGGVALEDVRRMLTRIEIPDGQRALYEALYDAEGRWLTMSELADAMERELSELPGLLGALGRRINETPGLRRDENDNLRGIGAVLDGESPSTSGTGDWMYRMKPVLRAALEAEGLV
jgi:uncharacterized protein with ParB-like and HNH nuclease domain/predicted transport protein